MAIQQVTVFMENRLGRLAELLAFLAREGIDLRAYSVAETPDFGVMRMIVHDSGGAVTALRGQGFPARITEVLGIVIPDQVGSAVKAVQLLTDAGISIEYTYAFALMQRDGSLAPSGSAFVLLRVDDNARAEALLTEAGVKLAEHRELF